ncbi:universal stress protein [Nafulsella turpanensis]|uniref:universal stress protein n=1 Tax=Nafulsella turpanensis TaxID=1265690 RepID=UPI00034BB192|nr:universal stress protein [Nafulsella turpanensis]
MEKSFELKKIVVCLDMTQMDESLIRFASYISKKMNADHILFVHIAPKMEMPEEIKKSYPGLFTPAEETLRQKMTATVEELFEAPNNCRTEQLVEEGKPSDSILKIAKERDIDLLVVGKKMGLKGEGILARKLAKVAHLSILMVPEVLPQLMDRILVPVDFSEDSLLALKQAIKIKETSEVPMNITCHHVYRLPSGWHSTGKSKEEFASIMKGHAEKDYQKFLKQLGPDHPQIPCIFTLEEENNAAQEIYQQAVKDRSDLIVLGSKGKTAAASALLGSTAERLAECDKNIPLLIAKDKTDNLSFLEALFKI